MENTITQCLSIDCQDKLSECCKAKGTEALVVGEDAQFICSECRKEFIPCPCLNAEKASTQTEPHQTVGGKYHLVMKFNDQIFELDTDDLRASIMSVAPKTLKTRIHFEITDDQKRFCKKQLFVFGGKMLFRSKMHMDIFLNHLIFKEQNGNQ